MLELIRQALIGLAAIPQIIALIKELNLAIRIQRIEQNQQALKEGFDALHQAKTPQDIQKAASAVSAAWNKFS